ncbi:ethanolamine utilization protein [Chaetomium sp. MPI-SDFR-AT-0129]|nr:ethanolamine utilization protein [Chaetomium sp. MPI-SDFR-AT-0129]
MPITFKRESAFYRVPPLSAQVPQAPAEILMTDVFGTDPETKAANPMSAMMFVMESTKELVPAPKYEYDETGIVAKGTFVIADETGTTVTLTAGDTFWISRGSTISFGTPDFCVCFKVVPRYNRF